MPDDRTMSDEGWGTDRDLAAIPGGAEPALTLDLGPLPDAAPQDDPLPGDPAMDLLEAAWGIIANAGWDGCAKTPGWQEAAILWRDRYHVVLRAFCEGRTPDPLAEDSADSLPLLREAVFQALGEASMCWENPHAGGVFESERAERIGNELLARIRQLDEPPRPTPVPSAAGSAGGTGAGAGTERVAGLAGRGEGGDDGVTTPWDAQPTARDVEEGILRREVDCWRAEAARLRSTMVRIGHLVSAALGDAGEWPGQSASLLEDDVRLLAGRLKAAESEVMRLKGVTVLPGMPGAEL